MSVQCRYSLVSCSPCKLRPPSLALCPPFARPAASASIVVLGPLVPSSHCPTLLWLVGRPHTVLPLVASNWALAALAPPALAWGPAAARCDKLPRTATTSPNPEMSHARPLQHRETSPLGTNGKHAETGRIVELKTKTNKNKRNGQDSSQPAKAQRPPSQTTVTSSHPPSPSPSWPRAWARHSPCPVWRDPPPAAKLRRYMLV